MAHSDHACWGECTFTHRAARLNLAAALSRGIIVALSQGRCQPLQVVIKGLHSHRHELAGLAAGTDHCIWWLHGALFSTAVHGKHCVHECATAEEETKLSIARWSDLNKAEEFLVLLNLWQALLACAQLIKCRMRGQCEGTVTEIYT